MHLRLIQAVARPRGGTKSRRRLRRRGTEKQDGRRRTGPSESGTRSHEVGPATRAELGTAGDLWGRWPFELDIFEYLDDSVQAKDQCISLRTVSNEDGILVKASLPEFKENQVHVDIQGSELVITADRDCVHLMRSFKLPRDTPAEHVTATFTDGELVVAIPRPEVRHVSVEASGEEFKPVQGSVIMMKAPGFEPGDISIDVEGHKLIVQGKNREGTEFRKSHILLGDVDATRIAARCMYGVLQIFVPIAIHAKEVDVLSTIDVEDQDTEHFNTLQFPVPGLRPEDFHIEANDGLLLIQAERTTGYHAQFERTLAFPTTVDVERIRASVKDGVLTVVLPVGTSQTDPSGPTLFHVPLQSTGTRTSSPEEDAKVEIQMPNKWNG